jgi:hypothetical protein
MKIKPWLKYLIYSVLIIGLVILNEYVCQKHKAAYYRMNFSVEYLYSAISMLICIGIGALLGLEQLLKEIKREGSWKVNIPRLLIIGLPSLYFAFSFLIMYITYHNSIIIRILIYPLFFLMHFGTYYTAIFQLIFGYVMITSFYKYDKKV